MQQIELGSQNNESGFVTDDLPHVDDFSSSTEFRAADVQRTSSKWNKFAPLAFVTAIILTFVIGLVVGVAIESGNDDGKSSSSSPTTSDDAYIALPSEDTVLTKIAFGSCAKAEFPQPFWDTIVSKRVAAELFIFAGDNVYGDCWGDLTCQRLQAAYDLLGSKPSFQGIKSVLPIMSIPDDHDYGLNDGDVTNQYKDVAKGMFLDFFDVGLDDVRRSRDGLYYSRIFGPVGRRVQIIVLDTRYFRGQFTETPNHFAPGMEAYVPNWTPSVNNTMLGEDQWAWLHDQLLVEADIRLIVSTVQVAALGHGYECWRMIPLDVARLIDEINLTRANGVVLLSGDRHVGGLYNMSEWPRTPGPIPASYARPCYPLYEITSSALTHSHPCEIGRANCGDENDTARMTPLVHDNNIGLFSIDWDVRYFNMSILRTEKSNQPSVYADDAGKEIYSLSVEIDSLKCP
mmetsp:Transcript_15195/g.27347  ORF Transcript_15195/g.27347 Transcript_15195/m.27347 type:complete len:458 (+) Transcript_15195:159-1532(+)